MSKFESGQVVVWYRPGAKDGIEKIIAKVVPQKAILLQYVECPAVLIFTDRTWAFSWNVWPKQVGRPSFAYKASLQEPTKEHYRQLLLACVTAILNDQTEVILAVSHLTQFPGDFPKGLFVKYEHPVVFRRIKANRLIHWLNNNGHSEVTMEDLRVQQRKVTLLEKEMFDNEFLQGES